MSKTYEFIKECGYFFVVTINGEYPAARPFGAIMEVDDYLYLATHDGNEAHKQLKANGNIQIIAKKDNSREWIRVTGYATESNELALKQRFMKESPVLVNHYGTATNSHFLLFKVEVKKVEFK